MRPNNLVTLANNSNFPQETTNYSTTAGKTWTNVLVGQSIDGASDVPFSNARFDGAVTSDRFGNILAVYMDFNGYLGLAVSADGGKTYTGRLINNNPTHDKPWLN